MITLLSLACTSEELPVGESGGGRGKEAGEEPKKLILQPIPIKLVASVQAFFTHQRHWQLLILHGTADGSGAGSEMEHLGLNNSLVPPVLVASKGLRNWFGGSTVSPTFCFDFSCFILFYFILF